MKTNLFVKLAGGILFVATVVVIGCSKKASTSSPLAEEVVSGASKTFSQAHFKDCPNTNIKGTYYPDVTVWHFTGVIGGCGNPVKLKIVTSITVDPTCTNSSGNVSPGQSKTFTRALPEKIYYPDRNGVIIFNEDTTPILFSDLTAKGDKYICPNLGNWTLDIVDSHLVDWHIYLDGKEVVKTVGQTVCN
ncbi:MAG: hypothetical protein ACKO6K_03215 [Chitinophagaceae bacterium]